MLTVNVEHGTTGRTTMPDRSESGRHGNARTTGDVGPTLLYCRDDDRRDDPWT